jgi:uncharacterized lipoprotein YmbA
MTRPSLFLLALLSACASSPPEQFYALSSGMSAAAAAPRAARSVVVGPAALPEMVDRPQLVTVRPPNMVSILDQQRWAEPLRAGVPRVVAEDLGQLLGWQASTREEVIGAPDCRVALDIRRFEARPAVAVDIEALWTVACRGETRRSGRTAARAPVAGRELAAVVAAYGVALASVSRDVAGALSGGERVAGSEQLPR